MLRPFRVLHVVPGQQNLGHGAVVLGKEFIVNVHHAALAYGGRRLLHPQFLWPLGKAQPGCAHGDGAGGHQNDLVSRTAEVGQHPHQMLHTSQVHSPGVVSQSGGAYLHHNALFVLFHSISLRPLKNVNSV